MALEHLIGRTVTSVEERQMAGYDTYKDVVTWTQTVITFDGGEEVTFGGSDTEVYDVFEYEDVDEHGTPIPKED